MQVTSTEPTVAPPLGAAIDVPPAGDGAGVDGPLAPGPRIAGLALGHGTVVLEGSLAETDLETVLQLVASARRSGELVIAPPRPACFVFADGALVAGFADSDGAVVEAVLAGDGPNDRSIRRDALVTALATSLIPSDATFRFVLGSAIRPGGGGGFDVGDALRDARHRLDAWRVIADVIPSVTMVVSLSSELPGGLEQITLARADWQVLAAVDGHRSVAEIMASLRRSAFDVCSTLYRLITVGVVAIPSEPSTKLPGVAPRRPGLAPPARRRPDA